ncbi:hypothetical protein [Flavobacterium sp.]|uniref:hypothetical protein n=1 Tax=Flavobacterium sp. TaxID=239 RepID=UPI0039E5A366
MHEGMSRGDEVYDNGTSTIILFLLVCIFIVLAFVRLLVKKSLGHYKIDEIESAEQEVEKQYTIDEIKTLIQKELILANSDVDLKNSDLLLADKDLDTLIKLHKKLERDRKTSEEIKDLLKLSGSS